MINWNDNYITVDPPERPKKITGTRFAAILNKNRWMTPFEVWCDLTRTYTKPFEENKYTIAGKTIEKKQIAFVKTQWDVRSPVDVYGPTYFEDLHGDFYGDEKIFGGMWDALHVDDDIPIGIIEMKTTRRREAWAKGTPEYYSMQAALYAYLYGLDEVTMVCSFLGDKDYIDPTQYKVTPENTIARRFYLSRKYPWLHHKVTWAEDWYKAHVLTGISPEFDPYRDAAVLKALKENETKTA